MKLFSIVYNNSKTAGLKPETPELKEAQTEADALFTHVLAANSGVAFELAQKQSMKYFSVDDVEVKEKNLKLLQ